MLQPRDRASLHTPQRSAAARHFGKAAQVAVVVGRAEEIMPAGKLRGLLGRFNQGERK